MNLKAIGSRIKAAREKKGLTQEALSEIVDLSPMHMSVIERGVKPTRLDTFIRIANLIHGNLNYFLYNSSYYAETLVMLGGK